MQEVPEGLEPDCRNWAMLTDICRCEHSVGATKLRAFDESVPVLGDAAYGGARANYLQTALGNNSCQQ